MRLARIIMIVFIIVISISILSAHLNHRPQKSSIANSETLKKARNNRPIQPALQKVVNLQCPKRYFNPYRITKYFNDEKGCEHNTEKFFDNKEGMNVDYKMESPHKIQIKNAFEKEIHVSDVNQGKLGDCYFLSSIAAIAYHYPRYLYTLFKNYEVSKNECYEIALFIEGEWNIVVIDNKIPLTHDHNQYSHAFLNSESNLWSILLEKAWAKVSGGYKMIGNGGQPSDALNIITGVPSKRYNIGEMTLDDAWKLIDSFSKRGDLMSIASYSESDKMKKIDFRNKGLVELHAYTLIKTVKIEDKKNTIRLVKLRNPWGNFEWKGKWSDTDEENWNDDRLKLAEHKLDKEDGTFHMLIEDLHIYFEVLSSAAYHPELNIKYLKYRVSKSTQMNPRYYTINVTTKGNIAISATVFQKQFHPTLVDYVQLTLIFAQVLKNNTNKTVSYKYLEGSYMSNKFDVSIIRDIDVGTYILMAWYHNFQEIQPEEKDHEVKLTVSSGSEFKISDIKTDLNQNLLRYILTNSFNTFKKREITSNNDFKQYAIDDSSLNLIVPEKSIVNSYSSICLYSLKNQAIFYQYCSNIENNKDINLFCFLTNYGYEADIKYDYDQAYSYDLYQTDNFMKISNENELTYLNQYYSFSTTCEMTDQPLHFKYNNEIQLLEEYRQAHSFNLLSDYKEKITNDYVYIGQLDTIKNIPQGFGFMRNTKSIPNSENVYESYIGQFENGLKDGVGSTLKFNIKTGESTEIKEVTFSKGEKVKEVVEEENTKRTEYKETQETKENKFFKRKPAENVKKIAKINKEKPSEPSEHELKNMQFRYIPIVKPPPKVKKY